MVADGQRRRQRGAPDPRGARRPGAGRTTCRAWSSAASAASAAAPGSPPPPTCGARSRSTSSRRKFESAQGRAARTRGERWPASRAARSTGRSRPSGGALTAAVARRGPGTLNVTQDGTGKPWLTRAEPGRGAAEGAAARRLRRHAQRHAPSSRRTRPKWSRGDVLRVRLEVDAQSDMTWVVVSDPVPGGATLLGSRPRPRLARSPRSDREARRQRLAGVRGAQLRGLPQLLRVPAARQARRSSTRVRLNNAGPLRAAADARRGDVRARDLRRAAERGAGGRAVKPCAALRAGAGCCSAVAARAGGAARRADASTRCGRAPAVRRHAARPPRRAAADACASTRPCAACRGCRSHDMSPALLQAIVLSEDQRFYEHSGVDWSAVAQSAWGNAVEHAHARRVDADDAARRPARRRPRAARRRPQRGAEARPGADRARGSKRAGRRARSSRPTSTSCRSAASSSASTRCRRRCSASTRAASTRRRRRSPRRWCAGRTRAPTTVAQRACGVLQLQQHGLRRRRSRSPRRALGAPRRHAAGRAARAALRAAGRRRRDGAPVQRTHARRRACSASRVDALRRQLGRAARPQRRGRRGASCSTTPAARCWPGSAPAATCRARRRSTACSRGASPARRSSPSSTRSRSSSA